MENERFGTKFSSISIYHGMIYKLSSFENISMKIQKEKHAALSFHRS